MSMEELQRLSEQYLRECEIDSLVNSPAGDTIDIIVLNVGERPEKRTVKNELQAMQNIVGGSIENYFFGQTETGARLALVVNEEGKLIGLPINKILKFGDQSEAIAGNCFIAAYNMKGEETSIQADEIDKLIALFTLPIVVLKP